MRRRLTSGLVATRRFSSSVAGPSLIVGVCAAARASARRRAEATATAPIACPVRIKKSLRCINASLQSEFAPYESARTIGDGQSRHPIAAKQADVPLALKKQEYYACHHIQASTGT